MLQYIVAACYSKACAPPPIGTGGSKEGGTLVAKRVEDPFAVDFAELKKDKRNKGLTFHASFHAEGLYAADITDKFGNTDVKYAMRGDRTGEWFYATGITGHQDVRHSEIVRAIQAMDRNQAIDPLPLKPTLFFGNFTNTMGLTASDAPFMPSGVAGFVVNRYTKLSGIKDIDERLVNSGVTELGNHVVHWNTHPQSLGAMRDISLRLPDFLTPMSNEYPLEHIVTHELGHLRLYQQKDNAGALIEFDVEARMSPTFLGMTAYGRSNPVEAHAESWAEFVLSEGRTDMRYVQGLSTALGWDRLFPSQNMTAASTPQEETKLKLEDLPAIWADDFTTGPVYLPEPSKNLAEVK